MRSAGLGLVLLAALAAPSGRALVFGDDPDELRPVSRVSALRVIGLQMKVRGIDWTGPGRHRPAPTHGTLTLDDTLTAPPGDWTDVTLTLDGPVEVTVERRDGRVLTFTADLDAVTVPLDDPDSRLFTLDLDLPDLLPATAAPRRPTARSRSTTRWRRRPATGQT